MTSLKQVAQHLESQGRHGDTMLMHVNPTELQVLEAMLGKTTRNPDTGLPEAFSWKRLLTGLGIAAAGIVTGGAALPILMPIAGGTMLSSLIPGSKKKESVSEAGKYLDERNEATKGGRGYTFAPPMTMLQSIADRPDLLGRQKDYYAPPVTPMGRGFAEGGQVTEEQAKETVLAMLSQMKQQQEQPMAQGRMVEGPGTGLSDSIPARLGVGEYVIPADAVSMLGDGSSDAGGRRLDQMVAKVRMEKTGTKKQAGKLSLRKVMGKQHG